MRSVHKLERQLQLQEAELRLTLQRLLPGVADNGAAIFTNSAFNPHELNLAHVPPESESLLRAANACTELRQQLGLAIEGSVGGLYLAACREAAALNNPQRRGPRRLAEWVLAELGRAA